MLTNVTGNPVQSLIDANYLGVLFWAVLLGLAFSSVQNRQKLVVGISVALSQSRTSDCAFSADRDF